MEISTNITSRTKSFSQHRFSDYWHIPIFKNQVASLKGSFKRRDQNQIQFNLIDGVLGLFALFDAFLGEGGVDQCGIVFNPIHVACILGILLELETNVMLLAVGRGGDVEFGLGVADEIYIMIIHYLIYNHSGLLFRSVGHTFCP